MISKSTKIFSTLVILLLATNLTAGCSSIVLKTRGDREEKKTKTNISSKRQTKEIEHDLVIEKVDFSPAPTQRNTMDGYTDYFFDPVDEMELMISIINRGTATERNTTVTVDLYETESGELPPEVEEHKISDEQKTLKKLAPRESTTLAFKFSGLDNFAQSHHLAYLIKVEQAGDKKPQDNEFRVYFWLLLGE